MNKKMAKSLKKGNEKIAELKAKYNEIAFELTMPAPFSDTFHAKFHYNDTEEDFEDPTKESELSSIRKADQPPSTNSRSGVAADEIAKFVDSRPRKQKRKMKKPMFSPSSFQESEDHSIKFS
jgi:hypothetical protein